MKKKIHLFLLCCVLCCTWLWGCGGVGETEDPGTAESKQVSVPETGSAGKSAAVPAPENQSAEESAPVSAPEAGSADEPVPESETPAEITLVMVGDILLHTPAAESGRTEEGGYEFGAFFKNMEEEISAADIALVNQEVIIGGSELGVSGYPAFNAPYELGDALADAGFDVILHATNHALDKGKQGILNCLAFWRDNYPDKAVLGIHDREEDIFVYEQEGIRIAILNYTYSTNGVALPEDMPFGVDMLEEEKVRADLRRAEELADFTLVCPHWGKEYSLTQTKEQERWARLFAENGADLIIGTHPHVIEPVMWMVQDADGEWLQSAEEPPDGAGVLVYYSLGNFLNWTSGTGEGVANRMVGGMARVTLKVGGDGEVRISDWGVEPLVCHLTKGFGGVTVYPLSDYTAGMAEENEIVKQDGNFSLKYCLDLAEKVFGDAMTGGEEASGRD